MRRTRHRTPSPAVVQEFNDRGFAWVVGDPVQLRDLMLLASQDLAGRLDFSRARRLNRSLISADLARQETDMLWEIPWLEAAGNPTECVWVYLLVEHQSQPDPEMGL